MVENGSGMCKAQRESAMWQRPSTMAAACARPGLQVTMLSRDVFSLGTVTRCQASWSTRARRTANEFSFDHRQAHEARHHGGMELNVLHARKSVVEKWQRHVRCWA